MIFGKVEDSIFSGCPVHSNIYVHICTHMNICTHMYTYLHTYTYIHTFRHAHIHTNTQIRTCIHTYIHTYTHTYMIHTFTFLPTYVVVKSLVGVGDLWVGTSGTSQDNRQRFSSGAVSPSEGTDLTLFKHSFYRVST